MTKMTKFARNLNDKLLTLEVTTKPENWWFGEMLQRWRPAGSEGPGLRVGIRDGYMNFYAVGQSIAKVAFQTKGFRADVHKKYLTDDSEVGQHYLKISDPSALQEDQGGGIDRWIERSAGYLGEEKFFVERVVAQNGAVIDLEMGLPGLEIADELGNTHCVAPRIDVVALEEIDGKYHVVFWEAKRIGDSRIRSNSDHPEVLTQIESYRNWMNEPYRKDEVLKACRNTCHLLVTLHDYATGPLQIQLPKLDESIIAIQKDPELLVGVDTEMRLLVNAESDRGLLPEKVRKGDPIKARTSDQQANDQRHIDKLVNGGKCVHVVRTTADLSLPHGSDMKKGT